MSYYFFLYVLIKLSLCANDPNSNIGNSIDIDFDQQNYEKLLSYKYTSRPISDKEFEELREKGNRKLPIKECFDCSPNQYDIFNYVVRNKLEYPQIRELIEPLKDDDKFIFIRNLFRIDFETFSKFEESFIDGVKSLELEDNYTKRELDLFLRLNNLNERNVNQLVELLSNENIFFKSLFLDYIDNYREKPLTLKLTERLLENPKWESLFGWEFIQRIINKDGTGRYSEVFREKLVEKLLNKPFDNLLWSEANLNELSEEELKTLCQKKKKELVSQKYKGYFNSLGIFQILYFPKNETLKMISNLSLEEKIKAYSLLINTGIFLSIEEIRTIQEEILRMAGSIDYSHYSEEIINICRLNGRLEDYNSFRKSFPNIPLYPSQEAYYSYLLKNDVTNYRYYISLANDLETFPKELKLKPIPFSTTYNEFLFHSSVNSLGAIYSILDINNLEVHFREHALGNSIDYVSILDEALIHFESDFQIVFEYFIEREIVENDGNKYVLHLKLKNQLHSLELFGDSFKTSAPVSLINQVLKQANFKDRLVMLDDRFFFVQPSKLKEYISKLKLVYEFSDFTN